MELINMKVKKLLIILVIICVPSFISAQYFSIGIKDGLTISGIKGDYNFKNFENTEVKNITGQSIGLILNYQLNKFFILQSEILYEKKGFDFQDMEMVGLSYSGTYRLNYITVPVLAQFEIGKKVKFYGNAGVYVGFLIDSKNSTTIFSTSSPELTVHDISYDPDDIFNNYEFGGLVGLGVKVPMCEKVQLLIDTRYNFGLTKAAKNTEYNYDPNLYTIETPDNFQNVFNRSFIISLGFTYKFNESKKSEK